MGILFVVVGTSGNQWEPRWQDTFDVAKSLSKFVFLLPYSKVDRIHDFSALPTFLLLFLLISLLLFEKVRPN